MHTELLKCQQQLEEYKVCNLLSTDLLCHSLLICKIDFLPLINNAMQRQHYNSYYYCCYSCSICTQQTYRAYRHLHTHLPFKFTIFVVVVYALVVII